MVMIHQPASSQGHAITAAADIQALVQMHANRPLPAGQHWHVINRVEVRDDLYVAIPANNSGRTCCLSFEHCRFNEVHIDAPHASRDDIFVRFLHCTGDNLIVGAVDRCVIGAGSYFESAFLGAGLVAVLDAAHIPALHLNEGVEEIAFRGARTRRLDVRANSNLGWACNMDGDDPLGERDVEAFGDILAEDFKLNVQCVTTTDAACARLFRLWLPTTPIMYLGPASDLLPNANDEQR